jgi:hypothetical protein
MTENTRLDDILRKQQNALAYEIKQHFEEQTPSDLAFEFPELFQFAIETILLQIWLNMIASALYDWIKGRILARKELEQKREKLRTLIADGYSRPSATYLDSEDCYLIQVATKGS